MLLVVLFLVLAAGGVLVTSVLMDQPEWAWLSVLLSVLAAVLLVVQRIRRRREASSSSPEPATEGEAGQDSTAQADDDTAEHDEPGEEDTDAADALLVSESDDEVVVVDERPRYHLSSCQWLGDLEVQGLPVREARELGFTACARCTPDAVLAGQARAAR